jgi:hypothetical protein
MFVIRRQTPLHPNTAASRLLRLLQYWTSHYLTLVAVGPFPPSMLAILPFLSIFRWK